MTSKLGAAVLNDPKEREKLIKQLEETIKNAPDENDETLKTKAKQQQQQQKENLERLKKWKESSYLFKITQVLSSWTLLTILIFLMIWARYMMEPLSHLVGYQLIVTDITVIDGDTFRAKVFPENIEAKFKLRLIDAPEMRQPFGYEASEVLAEILSGGASNVPQMQREVVVSVIGADERVDNSILGGLGVGVGLSKAAGFYYCDAVVRDSVFLNASSVQMMMVERGAAWAHRGFHSQVRPSSLVLAMENAQKEKRGLWSAADSSEIVPPWEFVRNSKKVKKAKKSGGDENSKSKKMSTNKAKRSQQPQQQQHYRTTKKNSEVTVDDEVQKM